ncbi:exported hypothetical protein [uncultured delta proteobacterium]|uniref:Lipoprotein n=1 Tax=uncultured delta proteobacterium TaxID=34034 RepID=A0A212JFI0_9DELT|nr:exported hypothetical protein [uncultured delta proteobacterium]
MRHRTLFWKILLLAALAFSLASCAPVMRTKHPSADGVARDHDSCAPLAGASVTYESTGETVTVGADGTFFFPGENYWEVVFIPAEAPLMHGSIRVEKAGYCPRRFHMTGLGGNPGNRWGDITASLLPDSHLYCRTARALKASLDRGERAEGWIAVMQTMRGEGLTREGAYVTLKVYEEELFAPRWGDGEFYREYAVFRETLFRGTAVWPGDVPEERLLDLAWFAWRNHCLGR